MECFVGRLGVQQRVLPVYRVPFFDALAKACSGGMSLFAGLPRRREAIAIAPGLGVGRYVRAHNVHLLGGPLYVCYQRGFLDWLETWRPDALIVEANPRYLSTPAAIRWMRTRHRPVIGWGLGAPRSGPLAWFRQRMWARFLKRFDALIAYSRRGAREYAALGFPPERIFVASNAVLPKPTAPPPSRPPHFSEKPVVLFVGRLQARKRVDNLLRACASLPEGLRPRLIIVGDGPERATLGALAQHIYPQAEFLGAQYGEALRPYFALADLFVLPGTGGLAVQEAMGHGLPAIVARGDGTQEDLVRPESGWLIPPDDLPALRQALEEALSDAKRLRAMGEEAYRIVREEVNVESMVAVFLRALNQVVRASTA
ncbi:MAG: glycosyltransferase [Anaerolineae bacterium]|nr:MAG: glycosyltransferase [Anaerolineae bacterium]